VTAEIRIGSRGSALAMAQATLARAALARAGFASTIVVIETEGDRRAPDAAWGEGAFVAAIERALLDGRVDVAVHSAKDVPTDEDPRLRIPAFLARADPRDALVVRAGQAEHRLEDLPAGARVGTDSPRRTGFVRALRPDLRVHPLHGNVDTRLRRLDAGETDALVLACAGLDRLGLGWRIGERLAEDIVPPAPGQGAIALQIRADDAELLAAVRSVDDAPTRLEVEAERAFLHASGGGCRAPIGALAHADGDRIELLGGHARPDGSEVVLGRRIGPKDEPASIGAWLAAELMVHDRLARDARPRADAPRVIVTRPADQARDLLDEVRRVGLEPVLVPSIAVDLRSAAAEADRAAGTLTACDWAVATSPNGARAILAAAERVLTDLAAPRWAAVGGATAAVLEREGVAVDFQPATADAATLAATMPVQRGDRVVVLRGDLAGDRLAASLRARGAEVDDVVVYRTQEAPAGSRPLLRSALDGGAIDAIVFTSGSTVRGLAALAAADGLAIAGIPAVCIGQETAREASAAGLQVLAVSPTPDPTALARTTAGALTPQLQEAT
jgi:hydroxymethylbilane synthase